MLEQLRPLASADEQHARYEHDGYLFFYSFLSDDGLARCRQECDRMIAILQPGRSPQLMISAPGAICSSVR